MDCPLNGQRNAQGAQFAAPVPFAFRAEHMEAEAGSKLTLKRDGYEFNASAVMLIDG